MARFVLNERYVLRGWDKLPFALVDTATAEADFFHKDQFLLLMRCDGIQDIDLDALPKDQRAWLESLEEKQVILPCDTGTMLLPHQRYRTYPCRYKRSAHWSITGRCNFRCKHCLVSAPHAKHGHPTTEQLLSVVEQMAECGIASVSLTGGEPLIRDDFWQVVDALKDHGILLTVIFTNGYLVGEALLDGFESRGLRPAFQMSYDGTGWHDWLRGVCGAEEAVDRAFALLQRRGYATQAAMCLHRQNAHTIRESVLHLASLSVRSLKVNRIQDLGEWKDAPEEVALGQDESLQAYLDYIPQYFADGAPLALMLDGAFGYSPLEPRLLTMEYERPCATDPKSEKRLSCSILKTSMYIGPDGTVCPCMSMAESTIKDWPNIFETPLREILGKSAFMDLCGTTVGMVRDGNDRCRACPWVERCTGGCRAAAIATSDNYFAPEPGTCHFFEAGWYERFKGVGTQALEGFLAAHPELGSKSAQDAEGTPKDEDGGPFSNC